MRGLRIASILRFMGEYTRLTGYPVPAPPGFASTWSRGMTLKDRGSERLLFTGALYQLIPYINATVKLLEVAEARGLSEALDVMAYLARLRPAAVAGLARPETEEVQESESVLRSIVGLLQSSGVDFAYMPEVSDMYSGALLLDLGITDALAEHAKRVVEAISSTGASEVIVIDPHTALTLEVYRRRFGLNVRVRSYLELVSPSARAQGVTVTIHDSCIYARDLDLWRRERELLAAAGIQVKEPRSHGPSTSCCGGPVESLSPRLASSVARRRLQELAKASRLVVTACPICLSNLRRASDGQVRIVDVSLALTGSLAGASGLDLA